MKIVIPPVNVTRATLSITLLIFCSLSATRGQQPAYYPPTTGETLDAMGRTYAAYLAQTASIRWLSNHYPAVAPELALAQSKFDRAFKASVDNIDSILTKELPDWVQVKAGLAKQFEDVIVKNNLSLEQAREMARDVSLRAEGNMPSPIIETLLIYHPDYLSNPDEEFRKGYTQRFESGGYPKALGLNFKLTYPRSWKAAEGERPHVVVKLRSGNGSGAESVVVAVSEFHIPGRQRMTESEVQDLLGRDASNQLSGLGAKIISTARIKLEGLPGVMVKTSAQGQRLEKVFQTKGILFSVLFGDKLLQFDCGAGWLKDGSVDVDTRFGRLEPLCMDIANSLVVENRWAR